MTTEETQYIQHLINGGGATTEDGGNEWHAYARFKRSLYRRFGRMENTDDYDAAIKAYCQRWRL